MKFDEVINEIARFFIFLLNLHCAQVVERGWNQSETQIPLNMEIS